MKLRLVLGKLRVNQRAVYNGDKLAFADILAFGNGDKQQASCGFAFDIHFVYGFNCSRFRN